MLINDARYAKTPAGLERMPYAMMPIYATPQRVHARVRVYYAIYAAEYLLYADYTIAAELLFADRDMAADAVYVLFYVPCRLFIIS